MDETHRTPVGVARERGRSTDAAVSPARGRLPAGPGFLAAWLASGTLLVAAAAAAAPIAPGQALQNVGRDVEVEGEAQSVVCSPMACLLSFEAGFSGLVVAIPGDAVAAFPDPESTYEGRRVRVRGRVGERNGRPRIEIRDPRALSIEGGVSRPAASPGEAGRRIVSTRSSTRRAAPPAVVEGPTPGVPAAPAGLPGGLAAEAPDGAAPGKREGGVTVVAPADPGGDARPIDDVEPVETSPRSRSRIVSGGPADGAGGTTSFAGGGRVRVEVAPPPAAPLSVADAAERLGLPSAQEALDDGAEIGGAGEVALLRREVTLLAERLAEVEGLLGDLVDRLSGLEQIAAPAIAEQEAREASVGAPPPRRGSPALNRVRRGYSAKQVLRVLGEPIHVQSNPNGHFTWSYDGGRVVIIDAGGIVVSAAGF